MLCRWRVYAHIYIRFCLLICLSVCLCLYVLSFVCACQVRRPLALGVIIFLTKVRIPIHCDILTESKHECALEVLCFVRESTDASSVAVSQARISDSVTSSNKRQCHKLE
jgi:hypothetical protein